MATRLPRTTSSICPDFCEINVRRLAETLSRFCEARNPHRKVPPGPAYLTSEITQGPDNHKSMEMARLIEPSSFLRPIEKNASPSPKECVRPDEARIVILPARPARTFNQQAGFWPEFGAVKMDAVLSECFNGNTCSSGILPSPSERWICIHSCGVKPILLNLSNLIAQVDQDFHI